MAYSPIVKIVKTAHALKDNATAASFIMAGCLHLPNMWPQLIINYSTGFHAVPPLLIVLSVMTPVTIITNCWSFLFITRLPCHKQNLAPCTCSVRNSQAMLIQPQTLSPMFQEKTCTWAVHWYAFHKNRIE